jgi:hypothetical protein
MEEFLPATMSRTEAAGSFKFLQLAAQSGIPQHFYLIHLKQTLQHVTSAHGN